MAFLEHVARKNRRQRLPQSGILAADELGVVLASVLLQARRAEKLIDRLLSRLGLRPQDRSKLLERFGVDRILGENGAPQRGDVEQPLEPGPFERERSACPARPPPPARARELWLCAARASAASMWKR
jgi:hypothetical protein